MEKEQAYIARQKLEQKAPPYDDVQISTSFVIPPGIHGDRNVTTFKEEGTRVSITKLRKNYKMLKKHLIIKILFLTVSLHLMIIRMISLLQYQVVNIYNLRRTPPIPPTTTPPPSPFHLFSSSQVSHSGNIPDIQ